MGAGLVGSAMIKDLANDYQIVAADSSKTNLQQVEGIPNVTTIQTDLTQEENFNQVVQDADLVVGALPGFLGYESVKMALKAGKNMLDISFFPEDPFGLDRMAKDRGLTVVTDCGVAPGMGNIILGHHQAQMQLESFRCLVGGLPVSRELPWQYKAVFSPIDVIEEYTRPARYLEHGQVVVRPALSDPEYIHFEGIGTLEAFNSDGLRSLLKTGKAPNMIEKTLRFPGTIEYLRLLRESGFFSETPIQVHGQPIRPIDFTAALVFPQWKLRKGEQEFTVMQIDIIGWEEGEKVHYRYKLLDYTDLDQGISSMARTTGYTGTAVANLILSGAFRQPGINPPEWLGEKTGMLEYVLKYLSERNVVYQINKL